MYIQIDSDDQLSDSNAWTPEFTGTCWTKEPQTGYAYKTQRIRRFSEINGFLTMISIN